MKIKQNWKRFFSLRWSDGISCYFKLNVRETWRVILISVNWHIFCSKKECARAHSRAECGHLRHVSSSHERASRRAFLCHRTKSPMTQKKRAPSLTSSRSFLVYLWWFRNPLGLEINLCIIVAALQQLLHLFLAWLTWVRTGTCISNGVLSDLRQSL